MKLFLALPIYQDVEPWFVISLLEFTKRPPCEVVIKPRIGDSDISRSRNCLAADFLASDCTHFLFLDSDLIFSPEHIDRLVGHAKNGHDIVAGLYPKKQMELGWVCNILEEPQAEREDGLQRVKYAGTGCLLVSRKVFDVMRAKRPEIEYAPDEGDAPGVKWDFFAKGVYRFPCGLRRYLSEDWFFCQAALDLGFDIWMDTSIVLKHVGKAIYPLQPIESFADPIAQH